MTSNINPNNIDGAYPVAGQDNNSQGFRDNFTNTSTNFQFAADEITDLQNNAILKSALTGTTLNNNMQGSLLYNAQFQQISETRVLQTLTTGSITINFALGSYQIINSSTGSISLALTNFPAAGTTGSVAVQVTISNRSHTLTIPNTVSTNNRGIQGLNTSTNVITFAAPGTYSFVFTTSDGGSSYTITDTNKQLQPFNNSSENLTSGSAANLALTTSYFSTVTSSTATLAAGVEGQIKTFVMYEESGNMVITVTNAGWGGAGTITFNATGEACTLQYINAKWFCIGNNGATFA
jgi:hypothetical protein